MNRIVNSFNIHRVLSNKSEGIYIPEYIREEGDKQSRLWADKVRTVLKNHGNSEAVLAGKCMESPETIFMWTQGELPLGRTPVIKIGMADNMTLKELNRFLIQTGRSYPLSEASCDDSILIYMIKQSAEKASYREYKKLHDSIEYGGLNRKIPFMGQKDLYGKIMAEKGMMFESKSDILYDYIYNEKEDFFLKANEKDIMPGAAGNPARILPRRDMVLSFCVRSGKSLQETDEILRSLGMEPLFIINPFEAGLAYSLEREKDDEKQHRDHVKEAVTVMSGLGFNHRRLSEYFDRTV